MKITVNTKKPLGIYEDPTRWQNSTLRYVPPVDFPDFLVSRLGKAKIMRVWITMDEFWDYRTGITYPDYEIGQSRYPVEQLHYTYDWASIVPAPSGTRFEDYLRSHSRNAEELMLNVRRYEREVSDGVITYDQYEDVFYRAVEHCKDLAPNIRYIECCNEVDIKAFGLLNAREYVNIYLRAYRAIQRLNRTHNYPIPLEIGGFGEAHPLVFWPLMEEIMALLKESEIGSNPMDFYSYHMYKSPEDRSLTINGIPEDTALSGVEKIRKILDQHNAMLRKLGLPQRPVFFDEVGRARATGLDGDSLYNAAGVLTYLIAQASGTFGDARLFPWCTFHNPELQMSYTQYLLREDGSYGATPNGIAIEMLHSLSGKRLEAEVAGEGADVRYRAIAVENENEIAVLAVNPTGESVPGILEVTGLTDGTYQADIYRCNLASNNIVYRRASGDGSLQRTEQAELTASGSTLRHVEIMDRDCFALIRIHK